MFGIGIAYYGCDLKKLFKTNRKRRNKNETCIKNNNQKCEECKR